MKDEIASNTGMELEKSYKYRINESGLCFSILEVLLKDKWITPEERHTAHKLLKEDKI